MNQTTTYKNVLLVLILILSVLSTKAQHMVVVGSSRTFRVPKTESHVYQWEVNKVDLAYKLKLEGTSYVVGPTEGADLAGGLDYLQPSNQSFDEISIKFIEKGKYTLLMTESNMRGCINITSIGVTVVDSPINVSLEDSNYDVVASYGSDESRNISIPIAFTEISNLPEDSQENIDYNSWKDNYFKSHNEGKYKLTLKYVFYSQEGKSKEYELTKEIVNVDNYIYSCNLDYKEAFSEVLKETELDKSDRYFEFQIKSVTDKYGANVNIQGNNKFVYGIYKKAPITKIKHK